MATIRYYDPTSGTWKTEQQTVPTIPGGTTLTMSMIYGLNAALADLQSSVAAVTATQQSSSTTLGNRVTALEQSLSQVGSTISDALSGYVTTGALTAVLAQVFYVVPYGTGWSSSRPSTTRPVFAYGGPAAPSWQSTTYKDLWVATV